MIQIKCVTCGTYELTIKEIKMVIFRNNAQGFQCLRCDNECYVLVDGIRHGPGDETFNKYKRAINRYI